MNDNEITICTLLTLQSKYNSLAWDNQHDKAKERYYIDMVNAIDDMIADIKEDMKNETK